MALATKAVRRSDRQFNDLTGTEWIRFTRSWFVCNPPRRGKSEIQHPAKFPETMAEEFITFFTRPGERVLDPFRGVGSTLMACQNTNRYGIGIEIAPHFHSLSRQLLGPEAHLVLGDARDAVRTLREQGAAPVQMVLTSPPYWNMLRKSRGGVQSVHKQRQSRGLHTVYSEDARDLGNVSEYAEFVSILKDIFLSVCEVLEKGRYLVIVCQNVRTPEGVVRPLAWDLTAALSEHMQFKGERIWVQDNKPLGIWGYPTEFVTNVHHHYCLVFKNIPPVGLSAAALQK